MRPKQLRMYSVSIGLVLVFSFATGHAARTFSPTPPSPDHDAAKTTVKGYVIDSSCTFKNHLKKPISSECAIKCARAGSPLVIQTEDGTLYLPISASMPASGQNEKLIKCAGQMVSVTGTTYQQGGSHAIVIEKIEPVKDAE